VDILRSSIIPDVVVVVVVADDDVSYDVQPTKGPLSRFLVSRDQVAPPHTTLEPSPFSSP